MRLYALTQNAPSEVVSKVGYMNAQKARQGCSTPVAPGVRVA